jgi:hypothetical protein
MWVVNMIKFFFYSMIVAGMALRLDVMKIQQEHFCSHKPAKGSPDKPLCIYPTAGIGHHAGEVGALFSIVLLGPLDFSFCRSLAVSLFGPFDSSPGSDICCFLQIYQFHFILVSETALA